MKKRRILVTGGAGFIGSQLMTSFAQEGRVSVDSWDLIFRKNIFFEIFEEAVRQHDIIIHLAAETSVSESFKRPADFYYTNVLGTARVAQLCCKYKKKLIFPSSASVYHPESSPYANSKKMAEEIVYRIRELTPTVILRFYNIFGPHMNEKSGSVMHHFLNDPEIIVYGDGEQTRDFIHIRDVIAIIKEAMNDKWNGKSVDVGTGQSYSINYVAGLFAHFRHMPVLYKPPKQEIKWSVANTDGLRELYRRKLTTDLEKDIALLCTHP